MFKKIIFFLPMLLSALGIDWFFWNILFSRRYGHASFRICWTQNWETWKSL